DILKPGGSSARDLRQQNLDKFQQALLDEVMPQVEKSYRVSSGRDSCAIAGLSMGGAESLVTGLNHLDRFAWIGAFSSGGVNTNYAAQFPALNSTANQKLHLLWIACGKDDRLLDANKQFCNWLTSENINYTWTESSGWHSFLVWRRDLCQFAPLLFQKSR
ncbi:MAG TPA: alpha/beta hydrolase-fold protein, partial [Verrucomicrobiae bacterium]|nr:alpha/beta hydrolase-fold protein [Verrucomicrobiae bacterium]